MTGRRTRGRRIRGLLAIAIWFVFTGSTVVHCSSGNGDRLLKPGGSNRAPIADDSNIIAVINQVASGFMQARDDDGDQLTYIIVTSPRFGAVTHNSSSGQFLYTANTEGADSFSFKVNDGKADSNTATVSIVNTAAAARIVPTPSCSVMATVCRSDPGSTPTRF